MRKFEVVKEEFRKYEANGVELPIRSTKCAAGYDFYSPTDEIVKAGEVKTIWTNVKFTCEEDEYLLLCVRSSMGKKCIRLANGVGIIDGDYYSNPDNDGNIGFMLHNFGTFDYVIKRGDRIGQGIIMKYLVSDDDNCSNSTRQSGFGSTNK